MPLGIFTAILNCSACRNFLFPRVLLREQIALDLRFWLEIQIPDVSCLGYIAVLCERPFRGRLFRQQGVDKCCKDDNV